LVPGSYQFIQLATVSHLGKSGEPDVFIAAENVGTAMHGDRVVARISPNRLPGE
jgi:exoribonuclease R